MRLFNLKDWFQRIGMGCMILIMLSACTPKAANPGVATAAQTQPAKETKVVPTKEAQATSAATLPPKQVVLTEAVLQNLSYTLPDIGDAQLKDGRFEEKYGEGETQVNQVGFLQSTTGDLNGDGAADAVVILWANTGGSGVFSYIAGVIDQNGKAQPTKAIALGDRVKVQGLLVKDGQIELQTLEPGPNDPQCCPSQLVARQLKLNGDTLIVTNEVRPSESAPALTDIIWQWERYEEKNSANNITVNAPGKYLLTLAAGGSYTLTADCNSGGGTYTLSGSSIKLEPAEVTRIECTEGSFSAKYLGLLSEVETVVFIDGELILETKTGKLFFTSSG
jgi:heat shock protein HslJ